MLPLLSPKLITIPGGSMARSARGNLQVTAAVKAKSARHICCSKTLIAKPEHKEAVKQLCEEVMQFTKQQMAQKSNGIHEFQCLVDGWDDNVFHFWERYESNVTLGRHNTRPEVEAFMNKVSWCCGD
jgi:quinol monooxygenase YgiN